MIGDTAVLARHGTLTTAPSIPKASTDGIVGPAPVPGMSALHGGPITPSGIRNVGAACIKTYFDMFYFRVHLSPNPIEFGIVTQDLVRPFHIWSAFLTDNDLNTITVEGDSGVEVGLQPPYTFKPLESVDTTITVKGTGAARLAATITVDTALDKATDSVSGTRAILFERPPNWKEPVRDQIFFRTAMFTSENGYEQRRAVLAVPRESTGFMADEWDEGHDYIWREMDSHHDVAWALPDYVRWLTTTSAINGSGTAGIREIVVEDPGEALRYWLQEGIYLALRNPGSPPVQMVGVAALDYSTPGVVKITTDTDLTVDLVAGALVHRVTIGMVPKSAQGFAYSYSVSRLAVTVDAIPGSQPSSPGLAWPETFDGEPLFLRPFNWKTQPRIGYASQREDIDMGQGRIARYFGKPYSMRLFQATWDEVQREDVFAIERFFRDRRGMQKSFWMPYMIRSFMPMSDLLAGQSTLKVRGTQFYRAYVGKQTIFMAIRVRRKGKPDVLRKVDQILLITDQDGENSVLTTTESWPEDIPVEEIIAVEWLVKVRFATDTMTIRWLTREVASIILSFDIVRE